MLSENFKKHIDNITDLRDLEKEIEVMTRIMSETDNQYIKSEMLERIAYAREREKILKQRGG